MVIPHDQGVSLFRQPCLAVCRLATLSVGYVDW